MHPLKPEFDLSKLVRELEEILAMVTDDHNDGAFAQCLEEAAIVPVSRDDDVRSAEAAPLPECDKASRPVPEGVQRNERDVLYDDALVIVTEFGQASPVMLQMWLSIDFNRATNILNQFQADGLVSTKGRVRQKAYSLRR